MADPHVITALVAKYAELQGKLRANEQEAERVRADIAHVEATIRIFRHDADLSLIAPRMPRNRSPWFRKGQCVRAAIEVLKQSQVPMSAREIALRLLADRGVTDANARTVKFLTSTVYGSLNRRNGDLVLLHSNVFPKRWSLAMNSDIVVGATGS